MHKLPFLTNQRLHGREKFLAAFHLMTMMNDEYFQIKL